MWKSKTVKQLQRISVDVSSLEVEYLFRIDKVKGNNNQPKTRIRILGIDIEMIVDTRTTVNIIDETSLSKLQECQNIDHTGTRVYAYGSKKPIHLVGSLRIEISSINYETTTTTTTTEI